MLTNQNTVVEDYDEEGLKKAVLRLNDYAKENTGCCKVHVASAIIEAGPYGACLMPVMAANECLPNDCKSEGCNRVRLYGDDSKNHRLPSDCNAIHSEPNLIAKCAAAGRSTKGAIVVVLRYPCEACSRLLIKAQVGKVYYCRTTPPSGITSKMFEEAGIPLIRLDYLDFEESNER